MKKLIFLALLLTICLSSLSFAAMKIGVGGSIGTNSWWTPPVLVITPGNLKNIDYDILLGYSSVGMGKNIDTNIGLLIGGTWWLGMNGPIKYGMSAVYISQGTASGADPFDSEAENKFTAINLLFSAKTPLVDALYARADVLLYSSVDGKSGNVDLTSANQMLSTIQLSFEYDFTI